MKLLKSTAVFSCATIFFLFLSVGSFAQKVNFLNSTVVPGAIGSVKVDKDKNKNYTVNINIMHLADPSRLTPPQKTYVVWIQTEYNGVKNIGRLKSASGLLSNTMKAGLDAVTAFRPSRVFVTAEDYGDVTSPASLVVLTTEAF